MHAFVPAFPIGWDAILAVATVILVVTTVVVACAAIYAGLYAKKAHEVAQSQRQIENSLRYVETLNDLLQNSSVTLPTTGTFSYRSYLHYHQSHPEEFKIARSGWPANSEEAEDNIVFKEMLGLFNIFAHSVLMGSANFLILYFYYGEYMQFLLKEMSASEATKQHLSKYSDFTEMMEKYADQFQHLPIREHFSWECIQ
jgi:hypothetical protein